MTDEKLNVNCDLGHMLVYDNQPFKGDFVSEEDMIERGKANLKHYFEELFKLSAIQKGEDEDNRDFDKPIDSVKLPKPTTILPRGKPIPKPKGLTKWEKYRNDKGIQPREKRSRMVYNDTANDWVPRWGKGSSKSIDEKAEWAIEDKPEMNGQDPFTLRKQDKKLAQLKQQKKTLKNEQSATKTTKVVKELKLNDGVSKAINKTAKFEKTKSKLKNDKKGIEKTLETVQKSTASMGKFDKKLKNEKPLNPIRKKDPSSMLSRKQERDRNNRVLNGILSGKK